MAVPSSPFDPTKSIFAGLSVIAFQIDEDTQVVFETDSFKHTPNQEEKQLKQPDAQGILRVVRSVLTSQEDVFTFTTPEVKRLPELFGAGKFSGRKVTQVQLWVPDPDDDTGKISLKSELFNCVVTRDGELAFGDADFSKATLKIQSMKAGEVTWTVDGVTT